MALTLIQIRDKADAMLAPIATAIQNKQATWILTHNNYWQAIRIITPPNGDDVVPDWTVKPVGSDPDATSWHDIGISLPPTVCGALQVDNHNGPLGRGYTMMAWVTFQDTRLFRRCLGVGFHSFTQGWTELLPRGG